MGFSHESFDPEAIAFMDDCLETACMLATHLPGAAFDETIRRKLAAALIEGLALGLNERDALVGFALRTLPAFRAAEATS